MTWLKLTAPSGNILVVNFDLVRWFEASLVVPKANTVLMFVGEDDTLLYVREFVSEIVSALPFGAQSVPSNRRNSDG